VGLSPGRHAAFKAGLRQEQHSDVRAYHRHDQVGRDSLHTVRRDRQSDRFDHAGIARASRPRCQQQGLEGSSIHNDSQYQKGPASENGRGSTGEGWKAAAKGLNSLTGGTPYSSGFLDAYPESIRGLADQLFGSQKRFGMEVGASTAAIAEGEASKPAETPIARVFRGIDYVQADSAAYSKA
jgi:hypothetical protein